MTVVRFQYAGIWYWQILRKSGKAGPGEGKALLRDLENMIMLEAYLALTGSIPSPGIQFLEEDGETYSLAFFQDEFQGNEYERIDPQAWAGVSREQLAEMSNEHFFVRQARLNNREYNAMIENGKQFGMAVSPDIQIQYP